MMSPRIFGRAGSLDPYTATVFLVLVEENPRCLGEDILLWDEPHVEAAVEAVVAVVAKDEIVARRDEEFGRVVTA